MQISDIRLTNKALNELGFIEPTEAPEAPKERQKLTKVVLPKDLEFLQGEGLSAFSILALMKFAKAQKTRLSDVVHCIKDRLASVKNKYSYIYAVLKASFNKDWAYEKSKVDSADAERSRNSSAPNTTSDNVPGPVILNAVRNAPETVNPEDLILGIPKAAFESLKAFMKEKLVYKLTVGTKTTNFMRDGEEFKSKADKSDSWKIMSHLSMLSYGCKAGNLQLT